MWYAWTTLLLVSCALGAGAVDASAVNAAAVNPGTTSVPVSPATTRSPPRTLDRQGAELAWRNWLQSPESGNQNAPPRRITTKSLFITPLVCPKGQRLDRNGCVQVVTVNKDEHERILLEQLNALFTSAPSGDVLYDYDDNEPGPLQLSIPIGLDPQAAPLQAQEPSGQAQELDPTYVKVDKKEEVKPNADTSIEAELEILKLTQHNSRNHTAATGGANDLYHNVQNNFLPFPDKPKRDSSTINETTHTTDTNNTTADVGQEEMVYGHVNVDPIVYDTEYQNPHGNELPTSTETVSPDETTTIQTDSLVNKHSEQTKIMSPNNSSNAINTTIYEDISIKSTNQELKRDDDKTKLSPENEYSNIGEAIKLISRYAEVTTDDNFSKDQKKYDENDDSVLGTRTKLQHRRKQAKKPEIPKDSALEMTISHKIPSYTYYRYPWPNHQSATPPADYPFRHLQDYWPGRTQVGGVYNNMHENPRRHHHSYPHNFYRPHNFPISYGGYPGQYPGLQKMYPHLQGYPRRVAQHHPNYMRSYTNNQDLYSLLGLRHWFSSEGTSKR